MSFDSENKIPSVEDWLALPPAARWAVRWFCKRSIQEGISFSCAQGRALGIVYHGAVAVCSLTREEVEALLEAQFLVEEPVGKLIPHDCLAWEPWWLTLNVDLRLRGDVRML